MASGLIGSEEKSRDFRVFPRENPNSSNNKKRKKHHKDAAFGEEQSSQTLAATTEDSKAYRPQQLGAAASDDSSSSNPLQRSPLKGRGPTSGASLLPGYLNSCKLFRVNLDSTSEYEIRELKRKLMSELDQVKSLIKRVEAKEIQIRGYRDGGNGDANSQFSANKGEFNKAAKVIRRVHSEVGSVGAPMSRPPLPGGHSVSAADSDNGEFTGKEKINYPAAVRGMDKLPPPPPQIDKKKMKKKPNGGGAKEKDRGPGFGVDDKELLKSCRTLLSKLKTHKLGWVFNKPVDAEGLGLRDYYTIVKHPMDLGTVETLLNKKNWYKSPREFAEDVRLTFHNAMLYNPKGQDVHYMADTLLKMFEEKWVLIEKKYNLDSSRGGNMALPAPPTSKKKKTPPPTLPESRAGKLSSGSAGRQQVKPKDPVEKKPSKAKEEDSEKREMTYAEKQRLSDDLQILPSEKLEEVVQIITKRNPQLCQQEGEIEIDIECVDLETLWELDRFVAHYKNNLTKTKMMNAEAAAPPQPSAVPVHENNKISTPADAPKENVEVEKNSPPSSPARVERQGRSPSVSSSSSSDFGSSSSDSDSDIGSV